MLFFAFTKSKAPHSVLGINDHRSETLAKDQHHTADSYEY